MPADKRAETDDLLAAIWDELTPEERREERQGMREFCDGFCLKACGRAACRKAHSCRGDPFTCADAFEREFTRQLDEAMKQFETAPLAERMRVAERILGPAKAPAKVPAKPRARRA